MSLKDKVKNLVGNETYEFCRGVSQGVFAIPRYVRNNYARSPDIMYFVGGIFGLIFSITSPISVYNHTYRLLTLPSTNLPSQMEINEELLVMLGIEGVILGTNLLSLRKVLKEKHEKKLEQQPKKPSNIDPWCDLEEPQTVNCEPQTNIDPWINLENKLQNGSS